jgi:hypothetical protein
MTSVESGRDRSTGTSYLEWIALLSILAVALSIHINLSSRFVLDTDDVNLALSIRRFDLLSHQPHPPGYLGYVLLLKAAAALLRIDVVAVTRVVSRLFALLAVVLTWRAALRFGADRKTALLAAAVMALSPIALYYGVDGQTHSAEGAMAAVLLWALAEPERVATTRHAIVVGLLLAAGGSLRPSFALVSVPPVLYVYRRHVHLLAIVAVLGAVGTAAWLVPTVISVGGWSIYRDASESLIGGLLRRTSQLSSTAARTKWTNVNDTLQWSTIALSPVALAALGRIAAAPRRNPALRPLLVLLVLMALPSVIFYALSLCAEPGYLAGLLPPAALATAFLARDARWPRGIAAFIITAELAFFFLAPDRIYRTYMLPNASEILQREFSSEYLYAGIARGVADGDRLLVVTDFPERTLLRQLPLLRPRTDVLFLHSFSLGQLTDEDYISFASAQGWLAPTGWRPGATGLQHAIETDHAYDRIVIDPRTSDDFRGRLRTATSCDIPPMNTDLIAVHLLPSCFHRGTIQFDRFRFHFQP